MICSIYKLVLIIKNTIISNNLINFTKSDTLQQFRSIFSEHLLKIVHQDPIFKNQSFFVWPIIILMIVLILTVLIKKSDSKKFKELLSSSFSIQASKQMFRNGYRLNKRNTIFYSINFVLLISFLIFKTNLYFGNSLFSNYSSIAQYLLFVAIVCSVYITKITSVSFFALLLKQENFAKEYIFNVLVYYNSLSIILFPIIIFLSFSAFPALYFLYPAIILAFGFYFLRLLRMLVIAHNEKNIGITYIFMYFCAFEILPILVLIKFLIVNF